MAGVGSRFVVGTEELLLDSCALDHSRRHYRGKSAFRLKNEDGHGHYHRSRPDPQVFGSTLLELEIGILPIAHTLDVIRKHYATQLHRLAHRNPVIQRLPDEWRGEPALRSHRINESTGTDLFQLAKSSLPLLGCAVEKDARDFGDRSRIDATEARIESQTQPRHTTKRLQVGGIRRGDSSVWAASDALTFAEAHPPVCRLHFFADHTAPQAAVFGPKPAAGQAHAKRFQRYVEEFFDHDAGNAVDIAWSPGHAMNALTSSRRPQLRQTWSSQRTREKLGSDHAQQEEIIDPKSNASLRGMVIRFG
ncbi:hypothetical protein B0H11DRAFT_1943406 [Mycena galericulata]|nr:hypothetical protein B0H11DRAFT_1943406 [Mycena galericulata]